MTQCINTTTCNNVDRTFESKSIKYKVYPIIGTPSHTSLFSDWFVACFVLMHGIFKDTSSLFVYFILEKMLGKNVYGPLQQ